MSGPLVLAIESATSCVGCAVGTLDGVIATTWSTRGRRHAESLAPQIEFVMAQAGRRLADLDHIAVDIGPGLYTGLRVGVTTARAMAHMLDVPVVAVSSLEAVAHANRAGGDMVVALDARRGEVFHETFRVDDGRVVGAGPIVGPADDVDAPAGVRVVGDGAAVYAEAFAAAGLRVESHGSDVPLPEAILELATTRLDQAVASSEISPLYLRRPDAVAKWEAS